MKHLALLLLCVSIAGASNCFSYPTCNKCLSQPGCGWYNYTNSCENVDSGLPLLTTYCPKPLPPDVDQYCTRSTNCFSCVTNNFLNKCGWNGTNCMWFASLPNLATQMYQCPYNPSDDSCNRAWVRDCQYCIRSSNRGLNCTWNPENSTCFDSNWVKNPKGVNHCKPPPNFRPNCHYRSNCKFCYLSNQYDECGWALNGTGCVEVSTGISTYANQSVCPWDPSSDSCHNSWTSHSERKNDSCYNCVDKNCGWSKSGCWELASNITLTQTCPDYNRTFDSCASSYHYNCFTALTSGKGKCGFLVKNNTALELRSGIPHLITDATKCNPIEGDDTCSSTINRLIRPDECDPCVKIPECGWSESNGICYGYNRRNATFPLTKNCNPPNCSDYKTCEECGKVPKWACGWSYVNNSCVVAKYRFDVTQFPNMTWAMHEPADPTIALTCSTVPNSPAVCSEEYMKPYLCNTTEEYPFDIKNCYTNSAVRSPSCTSGFFKVNETTTDFWGKREAKEKHLKCCPGYYCPVNFVCAKKCPEGSYCIFSSANYTSDPNVDNSTNNAQVDLLSEDNKKLKPVYCQPYVPILVSPQLGCGGAADAVACKEGYYCPNTTTQIICPEGHFCRKAAVEPTSCYPPPLFAVLKIFIRCPEGSQFPQSRTLVIFIVPLALIVVPLINYIYNKITRKYNAMQTVRRHNMRKRLRINDIEEESSLLGEEDVNLPGADLAQPLREVGVDLAVDINCLYVDPVIPLNITFEDLCVTLSNGQMILKHVNGTFYSGKLTAIMGPSGSGKTTLLSAIMGKVSGRSGTVHPDVQRCKSVIGFVPQEDVMHRELTVRENLSYSAKLRLSSRMSVTQRRGMVDAAIELLGLSGVRHSIVGDENVRGVSGGQRKRVNIGIELVTCPSILFLDEPTSGLDSAMSLSVCQVLKKITEVKVNVVAVIHQPRYDIFDQFDDIMLLRKGGSVVYSGPKDEVVKHFADQGFVGPLYQNPCDHFLDLISGPQELKVRDGFVETNSQSVVRRETAGYLAQTWWIFIRGLVQQMRQMNTAHSDVMLAILSGIVVGLVYRNVSEVQIPQAAFLLVLVSSLTSMVVSLRLFGAEKVVYWRESSAGLSSVSYFFGKNLASFPSFILTAIIFLLFYYVLSEPRGTYEMYFAILVVNHFCVSGFAHFLSILMHPHKAQLFGVVLTMIQCSVCGFSPTLTTLKDISPILYYAAHFSFCKWMMEALFIVNVKSFTSALNSTRDSMIQTFGYDMKNLMLCFMVLAGMGVFWRILSLLSLKFANSRQRR